LLILAFDFQNKTVEFAKADSPDIRSTYEKQGMGVFNPFSYIDQVGFSLSCIY